MYSFFCFKEEVHLTFVTECGGIRKESVLNGVFMVLCTSVNLWDPQHKSRNGCFQVSVLLCSYISLHGKSPLAKLNCILPDSDWKRNVHRSSDIGSWPAKVIKSSRTEKKVLFCFFFNCSFETCPWLNCYRDCIWQWENFKSHKQFFYKKIILESELFDQDLDPYPSTSF